MRRLYLWTISSHAAASPATQRRTSSAATWASSNFYSPEFLADWILAVSRQLRALETGPNPSRIKDTRSLSEKFGPHVRLTVVNQGSLGLIQSNHERHRINRC